MHVDIAPKKVAYNPGSRQPAAKTHRPREWRGFQRGVNSPLNVIELSNPKCLIRRAPPYRGVSEAVSSMSVPDRPTLLALFFCSRICFLFGRTAPRRWLERLWVRAFASVLLAAAGSQGQKARNPDLPRSRSLNSVLVVESSLSFLPTLPFAQNARTHTQTG